VERQVRYTYGLHGTPTTYLLEERLCSLEGGLQCVLVPSGLAALALVALAVLKTGDEVLIPDNAYGPNKAWPMASCATSASRTVFTTRWTPMTCPPDHASTRLVWLEAPGSVSMEFPDLPEMVRRCRERGVLCASRQHLGRGPGLQSLLICWVMAMARAGRAAWPWTSAPMR
jgi:cysteine-S-conjugate beta-lyase